MSAKFLIQKSEADGIYYNPFRSAASGVRWTPWKTVESVETFAKIPTGLSRQTHGTHRLRVVYRGKVVMDQRLRPTRKAYDFGFATVEEPVRVNFDDDFA